MEQLGKTILLVEDNPDDEKLTLRAFRRNHLPSPVSVVRDGIEALDFLFARGAHADRAGKGLPALVIFDLKLPQRDGLGGLKAVRADPRTRLVPVVVLISSKEEDDLVQSYALGANSYVRKPVDFIGFRKAARILGLFWFNLNRPAPQGHRA